MEAYFLWNIGIFFIGLGLLCCFGIIWENIKSNIVKKQNKNHPSLIGKDYR